MRMLRFFTLFLLCIPLLRAQSNVTTITPTFTTIDVPGAVFTGISAINSAGTLTGDYGQSTRADVHGFTYANGTFSYFDYPGQSQTVPLGINDSNLIVGYAGKYAPVGFLYDGLNFTTIIDGGNSATYADGINNAGIVVGGAGDIYTTTGFEMRNGRFKTLVVPGEYTYVLANAINNFGTIVGFTETDGFLCQGKTCRILDYPGATSTKALGINDRGVMVGSYFSSACNLRFCLQKREVYFFRIPGRSVYRGPGYK